MEKAARDEADEVDMARTICVSRCKGGIDGGGLRESQILNPELGWACEITGYDPSTEA